MRLRKACRLPICASSFHNAIHGQGGASRQRLRMIILGAPGAGKGTVSTRIVTEWAPAVVGVGDLLRANVEQRTKLGVLADRAIAQGDLLPDEVVLDLIKPEMKRVQKEDWILDGLPRTRAQAVRLDRMLDAMDDSLNLVVSLDVPDEVIIERIEGRWIHASSGRVYNTTYNPPKVTGLDDLTGERLIKRKDDTAEVFSRRLQAWRDETEPIIDYYSTHRNPDGRTKLVTISGNTSDVVWPKVKELLEGRFAHLCQPFDK